MEYCELGKTRINVSRLCFGSLTLGPLQRRMPLQEGANLIRIALEAGVNFIDTAQLYGTYPYIRQALRGWTKKVVVATKSYAYTETMAREALEEARRELDLDTIPIFLLHEQESEHTIRGHWPALEFLLKAKLKGKIGAVGLSTHHVQGVLGACKYPEIEIISPLINLTGIGIQGGNRETMLAAMKQAADLGKGIYAMKPLGGGHLISRQQEAFSFLLSLPHVHAIAVGVKSQKELETNIAHFEGKFTAGMADVQPDRRLHFDTWCVLCGRCIEACPSQALSMTDKGVVVDKEKCVFCGYCGAACPEFAIKVI